LAALIFCTVALAQALPKPHAQYTTTSSGVFVELITKSSKRVAAGKPLGHSARRSHIDVVCGVSPSLGLEELVVGFPGARLTLHKHRYGFRVSYAETNAALVYPGGSGKTPPMQKSAKVKLSGTVESPKLIAGTVSVTASGCSLKRSKYKATLGNH
jgi:hypothetical protein